MIFQHVRHIGFVKFLTRELRKPFFICFLFGAGLARQANAFLRRQLFQVFVALPMIFDHALGKPLQGVPGTTPVLVDFELAPDLNGEYGLSTTDLRHRAVLSGIWEVGRGFQMSGTHYTAIGERAETIYGGDLRNLGSSSTFIQRLRPDGTIVPRNSFTQPARNRTNLRVQQRVPLPRQASLDLIAEAFNVFNSPNWTISTQENNALYGKRTAGQFRTMQLGFRVLF